MVIAEVVLEQRTFHGSSASTLAMKYAGVEYIPFAFSRKNSCASTGTTADESHNIKVSTVSCSLRSKRTYNYLLVGKTKFKCFNRDCVAAYDTTGVVF